MSDTALEAGLLKQFDLLASSPSFAIAMTDQATSKVSNPPEIPASSGQWLVHGKCLLPDGDRVTSVFVIDTDGGGDTIRHAYWQTPRGWCSTSDQPRLSEWMRNPPDALFPCQFETSIPLGPGLSLI